MRLTGPRTLIISLFLLVSSLLQSQKIVLPGGMLTFRIPAGDSTDVYFRENIQFNNRYFFAVHFSQMPDGKTLNLYQKEGFHIAERLTHQTYLVETTKKPDEQWCIDKQVSGIAALPSFIKIDVKILNNNIPSYALATKDVPKIMVGTYGNAGTPQIIQALVDAGLQITNYQWAKNGIYFGNAPLASIEKIGHLPFVYAIRLQNPEDKILNDIGRAVSGASLLQAPVEKGGRNLLGEGVTVGVGDDADPTMHPDITDRVINHTPGMTNNHGTHVTGTIAGAGILNNRLAGIAPKATIVSQWFSGVWANAGIYTNAYNMVVTNNSYGSIVGDCKYAGVYDLYSRLLDLQAFEFPQLLHNFASGNDGDNTCAPFPRSYYTVLGGYQSAKNILTVGRTDYTQVSSGSSSSGPVQDGRLKPEITGLGIIQSTNGAGTGYFTEYGTSMSAPTITGGLALLYQRYRQLNSGGNPPGALMKAILLNGARDVGNPGPDYRHGYGTMMLERSLRILENKRYTVRALSQAQVQDTIIQVPAGIRQLKVLLYWHDPAANVLATNTLVHDLDLEVRGPGNTTTLPKLLNPSPAQVTNTATEGEDHTNNHEQVVIDNPPPGSYTIRIKGTEILTQPQQAYSIAFDYVPVELRFTNPVNGTVSQSGNITLPVAWEDEGSGTGNYTLEYSLNNGNDYTEIINGLKDSTRLYFWQPGNIRTTEARLRITKGQAVAQSEKFAIIPNISFSVAGAAEQCFGYFRINWTPLTPAVGETIDYVVKLKKGPSMVNIATVNAQNFYIIENLHPDSTYYAAVVARINGIEGMYNTAVSRKPNTGNCSSTISDNNLMLDSIVAPLTGRAFTLKTLTGTTPVVVRMRNLDDAPTTSFQLKYSINGGAYTETLINTPVAALGTYTHSFDPVDFSSPGTYNIVAVVNNVGATDPMQANDTFRMTIRQLPNIPISLNSPFEADFETAQVQTTLRPVTGLGGLTHWDYVNQDPLARARTFVTPGIARSGNRAITLDVSKAPPRITNPFNQLIGTFNLQNYQVNNDEVRLAFFYKHHGITQLPHPLNKVWVRGSDTDEWLEIFDLSAGQGELPGVWQQVPAIDLNEKLKTAGQQLSTSSQIRFGQYAQYSMGDNENFGGYSFDDVSLFIAQNDMQMVSILKPDAQNCGQGNNLQVTVRVRNGMPVALTSIPVRYRINGGNWVSEIIPAINAKSTLDFTFATLVNLPGTGKILMEAEVNLPGDNITGNNLVNKEIISQPVITLYPYYQDFEDGPGGFVPSGLKSTWEFGTPASTRINSAASGINAWKTRLIGDYNNQEKSYLYAPCFDISTLTKPMLSFSLAYNFEDCRRFNVICDAGWMEYSTDGINWQKLGAFGEGESWYDYEAGQVWMASDQSNWREAIIPLPVHNGVIRLRYVISIDEGSTREGIAIDNFHVYNGGALPLEWLRFDAALLPDNKVALNWKVANRKPGETFEVQVSTLEHSPNSFITVGKLTANGSDNGNYSFTDIPISQHGFLFYRIFWKKLNGEISVSPVRRIQFPAGFRDFIVFPNPADQILQVLASIDHDQPVQIRLMSVDGRMVYSTKTKANSGLLSLQIDLTALRLTGGIYFLELTDHTGKQVKKWMKR